MGVRMEWGLNNWNEGKEMRWEEEDKEQVLVGNLSQNLTDGTESTHHPAGLAHSDIHHSLWIFFYVEWLVG